MNKKERKAVKEVLDWFFLKVRPKEEFEKYLLSLGFSKEYAHWRANT